MNAVGRLIGATAGYLKIRYKIEIRELTDEEAFVISDDSNKQEDISDYERALEYKVALAEIYGGNQARMAARINQSETNISRYLALASLPQEVIDCYGDPRTVTLHHAEKLRAAMRSAVRNRMVLERAAKIRESLKRGEQKPAQQVLRELLDSANERKRKASEKVMGKDGSVLFTARATRNGLLINVPKKVGDIRACLQAIEEYLMRASSRSAGN